MYLIENGGDFLYEDVDELTPVAYAVCEQNWQLLAFMVRHGLKASDIIMEDKSLFEYMVAREPVLSIVSMLEMMKMSSIFECMERTDLEIAMVDAVLESNLEVADWLYDQGVMVPWNYTIECMETIRYTPILKAIVRYSNPECLAKTVLSPDNPVSSLLRDAPSRRMCLLSIVE